MSSISFDRAAGFYDSTRDLPAAVATQGIQAILEAAGPGARILDVGTGTGRISVPLLQGGADLFGCDLSLKMMAQLRRKYPPARLAQADAAFLPYPDGCFDALLTVHVMHLVGPWREALGEFRRALKQGGVYLNARTERQPDAPRARLFDVWRSRVQAHGASVKSARRQADAELHAELRQMGAQVQQIEAARFTRRYTVNAILDELSGRMFSISWDIPDEAYQAALDDLRGWAGETYPDPQQPFEENSRFLLDVVRF
jgi:ubiquinone/menaquinone biosynthesis C-methylase UbiE